MAEREFQYPPLPEGACHWETPDGDILHAQPWCSHVNRVLGSSNDDIVPEGFDHAPPFFVNPFSECWGCGGPSDDNRNSHGGFYIYCSKCRGGEDGIFISDAMDSARYSIRMLKYGDPEWPSVIYENPADWFDDNQVIDA